MDYLLQVTERELHLLKRQESFSREPPGRSIYKGVCTNRGPGWRSVIYVERKQLYLGSYESEIEAARAYDMAARNFIEKRSLDSKHFMNFPYL